MNLGRRFPIPQENRVIQNGDAWVSVTPEKPVLQSPNVIPAEVQGNPMVEMNTWMELVGMYGDILHPTTNDTGTVQNPSVNRYVNHRKDAVSVAVENRGFDMNVIPCANKVGQRRPTCTSVNSMAELMEMNPLYQLSNSGRSDKSIFVGDLSTFQDPFSQVESRYEHSKSRTLLKQNQLFSPNQTFDHHNVQLLPFDGSPGPYLSNNTLYSPLTAEAGPSSSTTRFFQFAPVTPEQNQLKGNQHPQIQKNSVEVIDLEKDEQENVLSTTQPKDNHFDVQLHNVADSSSAAISSTNENINYDSKDNGAIDLNNTPQRKPPKRRKHRPKVVVEGKPKRTPKPAAPRDTTPNENPSGKRKYVSRKGLKASTTQQTEVVDSDILPSAEHTEKSCKRMLNFDLEDEAKHESLVRTDGSQAETNQPRKESFDLNLSSQDNETFLGIKEASLISPGQNQQNGQIAEKQQRETAYDVISSSTQKPKDLELPLSSANQVTTKNQALNAIARNLSMRNTNRLLYNSQSGHNQVRVNEAGIGQVVFEANDFNAKRNEARQLALESTPLLLRDTAYVHEKRGHKRDYCHGSEFQPNTVSQTGSVCPDISRIDNLSGNCSTFDLGGSDIHKRMKFDSETCDTIPGIPSCITAAKYGSTNVAIRGSNWVQSTNLNTNRYNGIPGSNHSGASGVDRKQYSSPMVKHNSQKQPTPYQFHSHTQPIPQTMSQQMNEIRGLQAQSTSRHWNLQSQLQAFSMLVQGNGTTAMMQNMGQTSNQLFSIGEQLTRENKNSRGDQHLPAKVRGLQGHKYAVSVDIITHRLEGLVISDNKNDATQEEQRALVPYKGDGTIVPYQEFDPAKRRKQRPKVDLDPETNRLWNLLMGKEGSGDAETMEKDVNKEKWWEKERGIFNGRTDSFVARMRLVQGDRRFSPWKGSVVDSVIGVFLTQNVSDHLSSSAFMCLAAKFPSQPTSIKNTLFQNGLNAAVEEAEVQIIDPYGTITYHQTRLQPPRYHQGYKISSESSEHGMENHIRATTAHLVDGHDRTDEEVISSQNSSDSLLLQVNEELRSSSGSNSECEDQTSGSNLNNNHSWPNSSVKRKLTAPFQEYQHHIMSTLSDKMPMLENRKSESYVHTRNNPTLDAEMCSRGNPIYPRVQGLDKSISSSSSFWVNMSPQLGAQETASLDKEIASSLTSKTEELNSANFLSKSTRQMAGSSSTSIAQRTALPMIHGPSMGEHAFANKHTEQKENLQPQPHTGNIQHSVSCHQMQKSKSSQLESTCIEQSKGHDEAIAKGQAKGETSCSSEQPNVTGTNISNTRKRKDQEGNKKAFDWDSLRKQAQSKGGRKERCKDAMDSLNYEAVRCAAVNEIANVIKERGMNNMLAERMKDFLNRLVREHGSIDLEWLRDVPPDKAKEYLLSIRGLGLKSVECVRLLTLHHLAFPVDTNVGRIAVRLGWVPLQPLPESLQLHLLEMYPVLESIQKYLWPRLCQLDQKTLYELHYHMITFGKVFCTKSKPNCNACPMRGECRHFASAFASARRFLPGPEEKSIMSSTVPISAGGNAASKFKTMQLLPPGEGRMRPSAQFEAGSIPAFLNKEMPRPEEITNLGREARVISSYCEPIIEEPKTPEPSPEVSESDIEDGFFEDPDEIPMIELNMKEFTTNLETILQEHNLEGDLSKALVALNPQAASIPVDKLKNVSRLRTEHQVYELPDSHPLLEKLDRREPDDPSPYLLAIWTPGETENSTEPPETRCDLNGSGSLCNEETCYSCNGIREANSQTVRGTLLVPCRTAMRGSFPLNGTYFQVNEVFADHESSLNPIDVPRKLLWNLSRRTVCFGTSVSSIFKGLSTEQIQQCFWRGFVCVRGFDRKNRAPRPLIARLHFPASKSAKNRSDDRKREGPAAKRIAGQN